MNPQHQVVGYISPNWTAVLTRVRLFQQWVHNLHNHEKLVVVVAAYPSQHSATGFWSSFLSAPDTSLPMFLKDIAANKQVKHSEGLC